MRIIESDELKIISGGQQASSHSDFAKGIGLALMAPCMLLGGAIVFGGTIGHISGSIMGYQSGLSMGISKTSSCFVGLGIGIVGAAIGASVSCYTAYSAYLE